ncbi:two-component sensor histidine kinase [Bailinhaonella thermotolerans]|uniref:histidine kinase n=1 Tax=Bailinhaonella thermotolerans TaxID=1070861 RepID=A0A3A4ANL7_9ACTN|nr:two-component sensor histidine kinase [Bailinhaonella thermotolerans]
MLLGGAAMGFAVLTTWNGWNIGTLPVWGSGLAVYASGFSMAFVRHVPLIVAIFNGALLVFMDAFSPYAANAVQGLFAVALGVLAMEASWPMIAVAYALGCVASAVNVIDGPFSEVVTHWRALTLLAVVAAPLAIGRYVGGLRVSAEIERARAQAAIERREAETRAARLAERTRVARDLHDIVAHHVSAMVLRASAAQFAGASGPASAALADIRRTGTKVLDDLRGLLAVLRDPDAVDEALPVADPEGTIEDAVSRLEAAGVRVAVDVDPAVAAAPSVIRASGAFIIREGLTNVLKHAGPGTAVRLTLRPEPGAIRLSVENDAPAGDPPALPSPGYGLGGVRERVDLLGGDMTAGPTPAGGWLLTARLPYGSRDGSPGEPDDGSQGEAGEGPPAGPGDATRGDPGGGLRICSRDGARGPGGRGDGARRDVTCDEESDEGDQCRSE